MKTVFADTTYWIALLKPRNRFRSTARAVSRALSPLHIITSEMVLTEVLNYFAKRPGALRAAAARLVREIQGRADITVVAQTTHQFEGALSLYAANRDRGWSHTDCASFQIMRERTLEDALAADRHFKEAGFHPLLRRHE